MPETTRMPIDIQEQINQIFAESQTQAEVAAAEYREKLETIRIQTFERVQVMLGGIAVENEVQAPAVVSQKIGWRERLSQLRHNRNNFGIVPVIATLGTVAMPYILNPFRRRRATEVVREKPVAVEPSAPPTDHHRHTANSSTVPPIVGSSSQKPWYKDTYFMYGRPPRGERIDDVRVTDTHRSRNGKLFAGLLGGAALGVVGTLAYLNWKHGLDFGVPDWARDQPELYQMLENDGMAPDTIAEAFQGDPEFYNQLQDAELSDETINNIYRELQLYGQMAEEGLKDTEIYQFFADQDFYETVKSAGYDVREIAQVIDNKEGFTELMGAGLPADVIPEALEYPEIVQAAQAQGSEAEIIQAINANPELFENVAEAGLSYEVVEDIMLNPEAYADVFEDGLTVQEVDQVLGSDEDQQGHVVEPIPEISATAEGTQTPKQFYVEPGHGLTHELRDKLVAEGRPQTGSVYWGLHTHLLETNGSDYLRGIPLYDMQGGFGHIGIAYPGAAWWEPGVEEEINKYLASLN